MKIFLLVLLAVLTGVNIYMYCSNNVAKELDELQAGGAEYYQKLQDEVFTTEKYQNQQKENFEQLSKQVASAHQNTPQEPKAPTLSTTTKKGTPVLETLAEIKKTNPFVYGNKDARFTILEYSEVLCPFCQRHVNDGTLEAVVKEFDGDVNIIHIPYLVHGQAKAIEEGILCAKDQKDGTAYYALIKKAFTTPTTDKDTFVAVAQELWYNADVLGKCIDQEKYAELLTTQTTEARNTFDVKGTPWNVIIDTQNGQYSLIRGAYPKSEFVNVINMMKTSKANVEKDEKSEENK